MGYRRKNGSDISVREGAEPPEIRSKTFDIFGTPSAISDIPHSTVSSKEYLLNLINQMTTRTTVPENIYKEVLRFLITSFNDLVYFNDEAEAIRVKCRYGNPERTIARLHQEQNLILPIITISQDSIGEANERRRFNSVLMQTVYWDEDKQRAERIVGQCDRPVTLKYKINLWTKFMEDMDQLSQQIRLKFNPSIQLNVKNSADSKVFLESENNNYSLTLADREERVIRKSFSIAVETYIKSPRFKITSTGEIEEVDIENLHF
jgi:hypothetical protein